MYLYFCPNYKEKIGSYNCKYVLGVENTQIYQ